MSARERLAPSASKTRSPPQMANSGLDAAIFAKAIWQPCAASSSGWMWVSVKKAKSKEAASCGFAAAAPAAARDCRNFRRLWFTYVPLLGFVRLHAAAQPWPLEPGFFAESRLKYNVRFGA